MADSVEEFADLLYSGTCAIREVPDERWRKEPFYHPVPGTKGKSYTFAAGILRNVDAFDAAPFGISPREAEYMDPQQRLMLQVVWEALEDACVVPADLAGKNVGVYVGASMMDHAGHLTLDPALGDSYMMTGSSLAVIANRVSHVFDLNGPSMTIDTACSSSLFALDAAAKALASGEIDTAIVGATNALITPAFFIGFSEARMLSPTGLCQAFSDKADGYVRGEGAVAFVLQRKDLDTPPPPRDHGRLVHVGVNTTGSSINIALPSADAQYALLDKVYRDAGVHPDQLAFVEAHGTGTPVGDPIEAEALGRALGRWRATPLPIGSVKSNIGHLEPAAGCAGLLKALIALERRELPATLNAGPLNTDIHFDDLNLKVAQQPVGLKLDDPDRRLAGVSAFGFGGANAHAIVESPATQPERSAPQARSLDRIFFTSAFCRDALIESAAAYRDRLFDSQGRESASLFDSLLHFRGTHPHRLAVLAQDENSVAEALAAAEADEPHPALAMAKSGLTNAPAMFLFSGNGSQYPGMSLAALDSDAAYRGRYADVDACWREIAGWSLVEKARDPDLSDQIMRAEIAQPLLFADQIATVAGLAERGVVPSAVLGHSGGEVAAAAAAGILTIPEALRVLFARAKAQGQLAGRGSMLALQISEAEARQILESDNFGSVSISAINSPRSVSLSGALDDLEKFQRHCRRKLRVACVRLKVDYAFHHAMQDETETTFRDLLTGLSPTPGHVPFISSVTGVTEPGTRLNGDYWWRNVRQPVCYLDAVQTAVARGFRFFLEIGPDPVLGTYTRDTLRDLPDETAITFTSVRADTVEFSPIARAVARTLAHGGQLHKSAISGRPDVADPGLITYPWQTADLRVYKRSKMVTQLAATDSEFHPLLGRRVFGAEATWLRDMDRHLASELVDHRVAGKPIVPATALTEMVLSAASQELQTDRIELRDLDFLAPLPLHDKLVGEVRTTLDTARNTVQIASRTRFSDDPWQHHARARALRLTDQEQIPDGPAPAIEVLKGDLDGTRLYDAGGLIGLDYGPGFRGLSRYRLLDDRTVEVILRPGFSATTLSQTMLDPASADAVLHGLISLPEMGAFADKLLGFLPIRIQRLVLFQVGVAIRTGRIHVRRFGERTLLVDIDLFDPQGQVVARMFGARFRAVHLLQQIHLDRHTFGIETAPLSRPPLCSQISVQKITADLNGRFTASREDERTLLLNALAHRIGFDALTSLANDGGSVALKAMEGGAISRDYEILVGMLTASGLATRDGETIVLAPATDLPEVPDLLSGLLADYPDLGPECALLARLSEILPKLLTGDAEISAEDAFGRAALAQIRDGSKLQMSSAEGIAAALFTALSEVPEGQAVRLLEVTDGIPTIVDRLSTELPNTICGFACGPRADAGSAPAISIDEVNDHGPFDLIIGTASFLGECEIGRVMKSALPSLTEGGVLLAASACRTDYLDLIGAALAEPESSPMAVSVRDAAMGDAAYDLEIPEVEEPAALFVAQAAPQNARSIVHEQTQSEATTKRVEPSEDFAEALCRGFGWALGALSMAYHHEADLTLMAPYRPNGEGECDPVIVFAPDHAATAAADDVLKARLLVLSRLIHAAPAAAKSIWVIVPEATNNSPVQAALWSVLRTVKNEYPVLKIRGMDPRNKTADVIAARIVELTELDTNESEVILKGGGVSAHRVRQGAGIGVLPEGVPVARLTVDAAAGLDSLSWRRFDRPVPANDQVLVEVEATGLNYRDVMWSLGMLPEEALEHGHAGPTLGIECAGRVAEVGKNVKDLRIGDRVVAIGPSSFASHVALDCRWVVRSPPGLSSTAAASIPVAFFTAFFGLEHLARLSEDEIVLIHGGAGGVGQAAIQIARHLGARIIASAGTPTKRSLLSKLGVDHVVDSRSERFEAEVRALTGNRGVDVVLNALSGSAMERSMSLLRPFGRFVELGKQDYYADTAVGLRALKDNVSYFSADLDQLLGQRPELAADLFGRMMELFEDGVLGPIPVQVFEAANTVEAFRTMQRSDHIGKVVIRPPDPNTIDRPATEEVFRVATDGTLLIFGGGSGLGLALAEQQMIRGAPSIVLIGRSADAPAEAQELIRRSKVRGVEVTYRACDIADRVAVERLLSSIRQHRKITDIVNSAMVLEDLRLADLSRAVLDRTLEAKVIGTRNIDQATRSDPVRTFTVFTSMASLIGNHGQAAYVAANAYMEAIIARRRADGLAGLALGWGAISDAGYLSRNQDRARLLKRMSGGIDFTAAQAIRAFERLAGAPRQRGGDPVLWVSPMQWHQTVQGLRLLQGPTYHALWRMGHQAQEQFDGDDLRETLIALPLDRARARTAQFLKSEIANILRISETAIETNRPISDAGVDSLMGVELGLAAQQALGEDVPLMTISSANTIEEIAEKIADHVHGAGANGGGVEALIGDLAAQHIGVPANKGSGTPQTTAAE